MTFGKINFKFVMKIGDQAFSVRLWCRRGGTWGREWRVSLGASRLSSA